MRLYGRITSYNRNRLIPLRRGNKYIMVLSLEFLSNFAREVGHQFYAESWTSDGDIIFYGYFSDEKDINRFFARLVKIYGDTTIINFRKDIDIGRWEIQ